MFLRRTEAEGSGRRHDRGPCATTLISPVVAARASWIMMLPSPPHLSITTYYRHPSEVPIIRLPGINLAGFPSENGRESIPYKTEKALLSEPILTLPPTGI